ncbi:unnamed protein product, partial [Rotaria sp. Silwood2]
EPFNIDIHHDEIDTDRMGIDYVADAGDKTQVLEGEPSVDEDQWTDEE